MADLTQQAAGEEPTLEGGNYEIIRNRLLEAGEDLGRRADALNQSRQELFGGTELTLQGTGYIRTQNNCIPRDVVSVGQHLLVGYDVFIGLKQQTAIDDVFSLHTFEEADGEYRFPTGDSSAGFLGHSGFKHDFEELFKFYKGSRLIQTYRTDRSLLAVFQTGRTARDVRVFRWRLDADGNAAYIDDRGEREHVFPASHDFEWVATKREDHVAGQHPHISIKDILFVDTVGGDLTIKIEDNTADGRGVYREPVDDASQSLDDSQVEYALIGTLVLLRVLPFRETEWRHLVFNTRNQQVVRIDAIGKACVQLPEDQGIIFPGGFYLQTGEYKVFDGQTADLEFKRVVRSPNGEDVLYVFHERVGGHYVLLPYNLVRKAVQNPIHCHGYTVFADGRMVLFKVMSDEPSRSHAMQVWQTPFMAAELAATVPTDGSYLGKIGNAELVRGISEAFTIRQLVRNPEPTRLTYEDLVRAVTRALDGYYWLGHAEVGDLKTTLESVRRTAELIIDEFEKLQQIKKKAADALAGAEAEQKELLRELRPTAMTSVEDYMAALRTWRRQRGHLITLREMRYISLERLAELETESVEKFDEVSHACIEFLLGADALEPLVATISQLEATIAVVEKAVDLKPLLESLEATSEGLTVLAEVVGGLEVDDATQRTRILEAISEVMAQLNRVRAGFEVRRKELLGSESRAEFAAQFKLFGQSASSSLALADTPDRCDEQLSRLLVQLEELEARFGELDEFLDELAKKREEVYEAFSTRKQGLLDERQRRVENTARAARRILEGVGRRARSFGEDDELNSYFASDPMVLKLRQLAEQLIELGGSVKAEELLGQLKAARQNALRGLRDRIDLFDDDGNMIKLGRHRFSVNTQTIDLTIVPRDGEMALHLNGTDFYQPIDDPEFARTAPFWQQTVASENPEVYRSEFLAYSLFRAAEAGDGPSLVELHELDEKGLLAHVREAANERYDEGYERGVHDADATQILQALLSLDSTAGLLRYRSAPRALACLFWAFLDSDAERNYWRRQSYSLGRLQASFSRAGGAPQRLADELSPRLASFVDGNGLEFDATTQDAAARYLVAELQAKSPRFVTSGVAEDLRKGLLERLNKDGTRAEFDGDLDQTAGGLAGPLALAAAWLRAIAQDRGLKEAEGPVLEAAVALLTEGRLEREISTAQLTREAPSILGQHARIEGRSISIRLDAFLARLDRYSAETVSGFRAYRKLRHELLEGFRDRLRIEELKPRVMTSFVRNKLINDVYLPLVGDNLAKQIGASGDAKRTDLMGLLLLISPPGYGKTTLMEYIASQLGLVFLKVNGPALGHGVQSLDPAEAPNATARQEVEKINLGFEMGNNVMLYLDDIQHTHPELLQKFISLCDGQRRVEGVWQGRTRTYDLRGKKFCVVMAGNPYTESGDKFQIPDMLANRADVYNLGDILQGKDHLFALSYIENALTSNPVLAPLAARDHQDVYRFVRLAQGEEVATTDLSHAYSAVEVSDIVAVVERLFRVRDVLLKVNQQYILSASQDDAYRTEPRFQLQGSYRNMNRMAEKTVPAMNDSELVAMIDDHYIAEAQTLTTGAEANLLKLAELLNRLTDEQDARWSEIKRDFARIKVMGGGDDDPVTRVTGQLHELGLQMAGIGTAVAEAAEKAGDRDAADRWLEPYLRELQAALAGAADRPVSLTVQHETPSDIDALLRKHVRVVGEILEPLVETTQRNVQDGMAISKHIVQLIKMLRDEMLSRREGE